MTGREVIKILKKNDWQLDRIKGSHHIMRKEGRGSVSVPVHGSKDLKRGTLAGISRQTGVDFS